MPSRLARGKSTNARARLEALLRVMDWLTCALTAADWTVPVVWAAADHRFQPVSDYANGGRAAGAADAGGDGARRGDAHLRRPPHAPPEKHRSSVHDDALWICERIFWRTARGPVPTPAPS